jgi:hypothetical protein
MTSSNRSLQVYYTLKTLTKSFHKNIQIILVDDSTIDPVNEDILKIFPFYIDFITINRTNKTWLNPVVNYNIGFKFIQGAKIIIQNSEVCHVGDVLTFIDKYVSDNHYYAFDVRSSNGFESNNKLYHIENLDTSIYHDNDLFASWYCHSIHNNSRLHFLTACTRNTFNKFNGFSLDYAFSADYDDNDLLLRIQYNGIILVNVPHEQFLCGGIHLYHKLAHQAWTNFTSNKDIFECKERMYNNKKQYIEISDGETEQNILERMIQFIQTT